MPPQAKFARKLVRTDNRLMIESTCTQCGAARLVSDHDGTLTEWEDGHPCRQERDERGSEADGQERSS